MQRRLIATLGMVFAALLLAPLAAAQTELEPAPDTVLTPPRTGLHAELSVVVPPGDFARSWVELQRATTASGGSVVSARAESIEEDGRAVHFGVAELRLPPSAFGSVLGQIVGFGTVVDGTIEGASGAVAEVTVTLSESSAVPVPTRAADDGRLARSLDTASDVLFTIIGVMIVVAAAVIPLGVLGLVGYGVWRWIRRRSQPAVAVTRRGAPVADPEPEYVDG